MRAYQLPLASQQTFESRSFEEFEAVYARYTFPIQVERPRSERAFGWRSNFAELGDLSLGAHELSGSLRVRSENAADVVVLTLPIGSVTAETWLGHKSFEIVPGKFGYVIAPHVPGHVVVQSGFQALNITVKQQALDRALTQLTGRSARSRLTIQPVFSLETPGAAAFMRLLRSMLVELDEGGVAPLALERLAEALIFQLLHIQPHSHSALLSAPGSRDGPAQVRRVAEYLESCVDRAVCMRDLTALTGTTARSIQAGFEKHLGCSPMEFLRARRLERARALLQVSNGSSVAEIALACGFTHVGRFSQHYRARFGETPAHTRQRLGVR